MGEYCIVAVDKPQNGVGVINYLAKTQWNKGMSDFDSWNSVNCVLLDINLYETKREK